MKLTTKVCGFYKLDAVKIVDGEEIKRPLTGWFPNLITNSGLDSIASGWSYIYRCVVGTGSSSPNATDIALVNQVAATASIIAQENEVNSTSPYYRRYVKVYRFGEGVAAGNLSEVGITDSSSPHTLFSRALILDDFGDPTTITVLSDEYLDVTYEFRFYPQESDVTGSVTFTGNLGGTYNYTLRPARIGSLVGQFGSAHTRYPPGMDNRRAQYYSTNALCHSYDGDIGLITDNSPSGTALAIPYNRLSVAYTNGTYTQTLTMQADPTDWNHATGIKSVAVHWGHNLWQISFTPPIPKTADDVLSLTFSHTWARM